MCSSIRTANQHQPSNHSATAAHMGGTDSLADMSAGRAAAPPFLQPTLSSVVRAMPPDAEQWDVSGLHDRQQPFSRATVQCWLPSTAVHAVVCMAQQSWVQRTQSSSAQRWDCTRCCALQKQWAVPQGCCTVRPCCWRRAALVDPRHTTAAGRLASRSATDPFNCSTLQQPA